MRAECRHAKWLVMEENFSFNQCVWADALERMQQLNDVDLSLHSLGCICLTNIIARNAINSFEKHSQLWSSMGVAPCRSLLFNVNLTLSTMQRLVEELNSTLGSHFTFIYFIAIIIAYVALLEEQGTRSLHFHCYLFI